MPRLSSRCSSHTCHQRNCCSTRAPVHTLRGSSHTQVSTLLVDKHVSWFEDTQCCTTVKMNYDTLWKGQDRNYGTKVCSFKDPGNKVARILKACSELHVGNWLLNILLQRQIWKKHISLHTINWPPWLCFLITIWNHLNFFLLFYVPQRDTCKGLEICCRSQCSWATCGRRWEWPEHHQGERSSGVKQWAVFRTTLSFGSVIKLWFTIHPRV